MRLVIFSATSGRPFLKTAPDSMPWREAPATMVWLKPPLATTGARPSGTSGSRTSVEAVTGLFSWLVGAGAAVEGWPSVVWGAVVSVGPSGEDWPGAGDPAGGRSVGWVGAVGCAGVSAEAATGSAGGASERLLISARTVSSASAS
jgi:hypothetical protein